MKSTDLRCCAANPIAQRIKVYASRFDFCAPSISALLNSPCRNWKLIWCSMFRILYFKISKHMQNIIWYIRNIISCFKSNIKKLRTLPGIVLSLAFLFYFILTVISFLHKHHLSNCDFLNLYCLNKEQLITYGVGLIGALIIYFQLISIQEQYKIQTLIDYSKQWNTDQMRKNRKNAMKILVHKNVHGKNVNLDCLEQVLELLEDFSTLVYKGVIDKKLVWDSSLGWYASRYFYFSEQNNSIREIRRKWCIRSEEDDTYYENLQTLYDNYLDYEVKEVKIEDGKLNKKEKRKYLEKTYLERKDEFIEAENGLE